MKRKGIIAGVLMVLVMLLFCPTIVNDGSREGLLLWFNVVLPALLPFMIFSGIMMRLGVTSVVGRLIYPFVHGLLKLSENGCYAFVIGWLSGYPLGAKTVADLYEAGDISKGEAQYLLVFCNNASPMFMLEYMGVYCLGIKQPWMLPGVVCFSALLNAVLHKKRYFKEIDTAKHNSIGSRGKKRYSLMEALDESILDSFVTVTRVGGYIILFSIMAHFMEQASFFHGGIKLAGLGLIEIATGGEYLKSCVIPAWQKWILGCVFTAFGGLSSVAQTFGVIRKTDLSQREYITAKILHSLLAAGCGFLLWFFYIFISNFVR
jgi:sporulation integral membrane protein YlbJ